MMMSQQTVNRVLKCEMAPSLAYGWLVWIIVVALGEASTGDRHPLYIRCLDRYVLFSLLLAAWFLIATRRLPAVVAIVEVQQTTVQ